MPIQLTPELTQYVQDQLSANTYSSQEELLVDALRIHRELSVRHMQLRNDIQEAMTALDAGEGRPHSMGDVKTRLAERFQREQT